jgi:phosphoribosylglycinamide formyltransferase-1
VTATPTPLVVLISGGGTTLKNLIDKIAARELDAQIRLVISSSAKAGGLEFGRAAGIPTEVITLHGAGGPQAFSQAIFDRCRAVATELVVMAGFLKHTAIPGDFVDRVVNIHPSLIPKFCGHGFYGLKVHEAVLAAGEAESGCTVHFVDDQFDHGPIILQRRVPVLKDDTPDALQRRVFAAECEAYPEALRMVAAERRASAAARPGQ